MVVSVEFGKASSYVNGEWITTKGNVIPIINPYSSEQIGEQVQATPKQVEEAIASAYTAREEVAKLTSFERATILKRAAQLLTERRDEFAQIISLELGKPIRYTLDEVTRSIETLELSAEEAKRLNGETLPGDVSSRGAQAVAVTFRVPVGVVAAITPFNAPLNLVAHKVGPAFAAGNSIILKPATSTVLIATKFVKLLIEAGFPKTALNMVLGRRDAVQQIVKDDRVNVISFTGGLVASRNISQLAGIKKVLLELGGNASTVVHEDANINRAAAMCARTGYSNSGQSCISVQRIYVHDSIIEEFTEKVIQQIELLKVGDPLSLDTDIGSMVDEANANRMMEWIEEAVNNGAKVLTGGVKEGAVVRPTLLLNPPHECKVVCDEVFGPIMSIIPYKTLQEAIDATNNSDFGLQAGIFTNRMDVAQKFANAIHAGGVVINGTSNFRLDHWPYGGIKNSGIGREGPRYTIQELTEMKMIVYQIEE